MENQPLINHSESSELISQPPVAFQTKTSLLVPILLTALVSAFIFGIGGYYFGRQSFQTDGTKYQAQAPLITPTASIQTDQAPTQILSPVSEDIENQIGYIESIFEMDGRNYLTIDYALWLSQSKGECNLSPKRQSGIPECNPNGYLVVNEDPQTITLEIDKSVLIDFSDFKNASLAWKDGRPLTSEFLTLEEFREIFSGDVDSIKWLEDAIYNVSLSKNIVVKIKYQYAP